jgi:transcriptional regulator with GAF, ATPase, and Fis domain
MNMDTPEFFREATLRICGDLEIEKALSSTLQFLRKVMPVDSMFLEHYDAGFDSMRTIAIANKEESKKVDLLTPLSNEAIKQANDKFFSESTKIYLFEDVETEKLAQEMLNFHNVKASSLMVLPLASGGQMIGTLAITSESNHRFSKEHADLLVRLKEPFSIAMSNALRHREVVKLKDLLSDDNRYLHRELRLLTENEIIGANFGLKEVMDKVHRVSALDSPVLLLGETGVGKDLIANAIHYSSLRKNGPFIKVNCGAIPESLIDSELFGHEKGAFTGAVSQQRGRFERAQKGTIFLDEIGELPAHAQVRLLRVLQDKEIERVGGNKTISLDIRIIAATNRDLEDMMKHGQFREDLWFRLNVFQIWIPPLNQHKTDIPALLDHFILQKSKELKLSKIPAIAPGQVEILMNYDWPGNVRELQNVVERSLILNPQGPISFESLNTNDQRTHRSMHVHAGKVENLDVAMSRHIRLALEQCEGKIHGKGGAAELLGINPNTLRNRMQKLGIKFHRRNNLP